MTHSSTLENSKVTREMIEQLMMIAQGGAFVPSVSRRCNCDPLGPHSCMTPSESMVPSYLTSIAGSIAASIAASGFASRRDSLGLEERRRESLGLGDRRRESLGQWKASTAGIARNSSTVGGREILDG